MDGESSTREPEVEGCEYEDADAGSIFTMPSDGEGYESDHDGGAPPPPRQLRREYSTCSGSELIPRLQQRIQEVVDEQLLGLTADEAAVFLGWCNWDKRKLEELFFETDDLRAKVGVSAAPDPPPLPAGMRPDSIFFCSIEMEDATFADADACACGHWFSAKAWRGLLKEAIKFVDSARAVSCPEDGCRERCRLRLLARFLTELELGRYWELIGKAYAASSGAARWCPAPGCSSVVLMHATGAAIDVTCGAGHPFCFACLDAPHRPAQCGEVKRWRTSETNDAGNAVWMLAHTKPCPKCRRPIFKDQGCQQMRCGGLQEHGFQTTSKAFAGCGHTFCWMCLRDWATHTGGYYGCTTAPDPATHDASAADRARAELALLAFVAERFGEHMRGARYASEHRGDVERWQAELVATRIGAAEALSGDLGFTQRAIDVIVRGRRAAAWGHVHSFYCADARYKALFDDSRGRLEAHLEHLQNLLELHTIRAVADGTFEVPSFRLPDAGGVGASAVAVSGTADSAPAAASAVVGKSSVAPSGGAFDVGTPSPSAAGAGATVSTTGGGNGEAVRRALCAWRQAATNLLGCTDHFITRLLEAVDAGDFLCGGGVSAGAGAGAALPPGLALQRAASSGCSAASQPSRRQQQRRRVHGAAAEPSPGAGAIHRERTDASTASSSSSVAEVDAAAAAVAAEEARLLELAVRESLEATAVATAAAPTSSQDKAL